jgi:predicted Zn-dependent protease with MMP-like domain
LDERTRARFDRELEWVLERLPERVHELIEEVPLHVEDHPSPRMMADLGVRRRSQLCGLYTGIPLSEKSIQHSGQMPDVVTIFREGIMASARGYDGRVRRARLREEIRITVLHELAHHHGIDEDELAELGYG